MTTATKLKPVDEWLESVAGRTLHMATETGTYPTSAEEVLAIAHRCDQSEILTDARLTGVYEKHLKMWYGDYLEWCRSGGQSETSRAWFVTAT